MSGDGSPFVRVAERVLGDSGRTARSAVPGRCGAAEGKPHIGRKVVDAVRQRQQFGRCHGGFEDGRREVGRDEHEVNAVVHARVRPPSGVGRATAEGRGQAEPQLERESVELFAAGVLGGGADGANGR